MGNQVGTITNYVTSMMEVLAKFPKDSEEYKTLEYRIECGQLFQQAELDKIKGILATPMPSDWYNISCSAFYCGWKRYRIFYFWHYCSYIGIYLGFKREFSKLIGFLVVALVAVGLACIQYVRRKRRIVTVI